MIVLALVFILTQSTPPVTGGDKDTVVVTARSLTQTERALAECLARRCPPKEDIDARLAHGENLFLAGDYAKARHVLGQSRGRNMRYAKTLPVEVGDLARAYGRLSTFDGFSDVGRISQIDSLDALKAGLDRDDARVLMQRLLVADEFIRQGRLVAGDDIYKTVERQATAAGLPNVRGSALLRQALVYGALASVDPKYRPAARHRIKRIEDTTDPALAPFRDAVGLLRAQLAALEGDDRALEAAIAAVGAWRYPRPILVYNPPIDIDVRPRSESGVVENQGDARPQWIDLTFEIGSDGKVSDIDVLRKSDTVYGDWPERVRKSVAKRRYAPIAAEVSPALLRRTERFSMVFDVVPARASRIPSRSARGRVVSLDLTEESPPTPPAD